MGNVEGLSDYKRVSASGLLMSERYTDVMLRCFEWNSARRSVSEGEEAALLQVDRQP